MLDVLKQPFIQTARSKGLSENAVNWKHAARIAINPIISRIIGSALKIDFKRYFYIFNIYLNAGLIYGYSNIYSFFDF